MAERIIQLIELRHRAEEVQFLRRRAIRHDDFPEIIGKSRALKDVLEMVKKVAPTQATVLITGESGTGKEPSPAPFMPIAIAGTKSFYQ